MMFTLNVDGRTVEYSILENWQDGTVWITSQAETDRNLANADRIALMFSGASGAWVAENHYGNEECWNALGDMDAAQVYALREQNIRYAADRILARIQSWLSYDFAHHALQTTDADSLCHIADRLVLAAHNEMGDVTMGRGKLFLDAADAFLTLAQVATL